MSVASLFEGFERRRVDVGGLGVNCVVGGGGPPLLLLHGYPQSLAMWADIAPILAADYTVVCADLRGYGDSDKPRATAGSANYSFRQMAADQVGLMARLGHTRFHVVGHDRGGRAAHRMALDHPDAVASLAVLDIVPTHTMFMRSDRRVAGAYWHWYFLSQPEPLPERLIGYDPDLFYQNCLTGWGKARLEDFAPDMLAEYRRCWRDPAAIHASCADYRAAAGVDLEHDQADIDKKVTCPTLALYGADGAMATLFDIPATWRERCDKLRTASLPGGHFFADLWPRETARVLADFLGNQT